MSEAGGLFYIFVSNMQTESGPHAANDARSNTLGRE